MTFHCTPPPGAWINDPNALYFAGGRYRLLMQHSPEPEPGPVGWGAASSDDLLDWRWDGVAIGPDARGHAYSGCLVDGDAYLTRHHPVTHVETQHVRAPVAAADGPAIGPAGRNRRDPFVFRNASTADWRMLVAAPCDWTDWRRDPPSMVEVWRSIDRVDWSPAGLIGPWSPPGVMWEVPVLIRLDDLDVLILSMVDRRQDVADCAVRYWTGRYDQTFVPAADCPVAGRPLDLGPDFYAAIVNTAQDWPLPEPHLIAWASNWRYARQLRSGGGPLTLPRRLNLRDGRLRQRPARSAAHLACWRAQVDSSFSVRIRRGGSRLHVAVDAAGAATVERAGADELDWRREYPPGTLAPDRARELTLFADGPLVELFIAPDDLTVTALIPAPGDLEVDVA